MFDSADDARRALEGAFEPQLVDQIVAALVPAIVLAPADGDRLGGTRLGGTPDLPPGLDWPRPMPPDDPEEIARRAHADMAAEMREHFERRAPYTFMAQIDLAEIAALGDVAVPLPDEGRLLFFYELAVGPWETSSRVARVIWDRTPQESLTASALPAELVEAADCMLAQQRKSSADAGFEPPSGNGNTYRLPVMPRTAVRTLRLPHTHAFDLEAVPTLDSVCKAPRDASTGNDLYFSYSDALEGSGDGYPDEAWRGQQLLGAPIPEQDDPRYDAAEALRDGQLTSSDANRERTEAEARDWRLLLQIALLEWEASVAPGMVYFLIHGGDLEARRFDRVVAVYQQT